MRCIAYILGATRVETYPGLLVDGFGHLVRALMLPETLPWVKCWGSILTLHTVAPYCTQGHDCFPSARDVRVRELNIASGSLGITNIVRNDDRKKKKSSVTAV
jgi:hypothetical protein